MLYALVTPDFFGFSTLFEVGEGACIRAVAESILAGTTPAYKMHQGEVSTFFDVEDLLFEDYGVTPRGFTHFSIYRATPIARHIYEAKTSRGTWDFDATSLMDAIAKAEQHFKDGGVWEEGERVEFQLYRINPSDWDYYRDTERQKVAAGTYTIPTLSRHEVLGHE